MCICNVTEAGTEHASENKEDDARKNRAYQHDNEHGTGEVRLIHFPATAACPYKEQDQVDDGQHHKHLDDDIDAS